MTAIADASDATLWGWGAWAAVALILLAAIGAVLYAESTHPLPTPHNAAPASDEPTRAPVRACPPALRVHLCTRGCGRNVARAGESCYPVCCSPVHDAERILRGEA